MNISNCPRCDEPFRVPVGDLSPDAYAQCPWCSETFPLSEVLNRLPPVLTLLSADGTPVELAHQPFVASTESTAQESLPSINNFTVDDGAVANDETVEFVEETPFDPIVPVEPDHIGMSEPLVSASPTIQATRRRQSGGGLRSLLRIVFGGMLSVPIAYGILWGLGTIGYGPLAESSGPGSNRVVASKPVDLTVDRRPPIQSPSPNESVSDDLSNGEAYSKPAPAESSLTLPEMNLSTTEPTAPKLEADLESSAPKGVTVVDFDLQPESEEMVTTVKRALKMIDALNKLPVDDSRRQRWLTRTYQTIASASRIAISNGLSTRQLADAIKSSSILDDLDKAGSDWLDFESRDDDGVLLVGDSNGTSVTLGSGQQVKILGQASLPASGRVIVMGRILNSQSVTAVLVDTIEKS